jgi:hypothetical protein
MSNAINTLSCQHCGNNNPNFMSFGSIDFVKPEYENNYMFINNYEATPKLAVGFYFSCGKCGKDTVIIPTSFGQRKYSSAIPQQIIYTPAFNKVVFAIYNSGLNTGKLDQLILDSQGMYTSSLTGQKVVSDGSWRDLDSQMYNLLLAQGVKEVTDVRNGQHDGITTGTLHGERTGSTNDTKVAVNDTTTTTTSNVTNTTNDTTTKGNVS